MNKKQKSFILIFLFFLLFITIIDYGNNTDLRTDSGWDSGYSGGGGGSSWGGGGGGSSWSSSGRSGSSGYSSYSYDPKYEAYGFAIMGIAFLVVMMIAIAKSLTNTEEEEEKSKKISKYEEFMSNYDNIMESLENNTAVDIVEDDDVRRILPKETMESLVKKLVDKFIAIQNAWMDFDYDALRSLCSDELFNTYKAQLDALKIKNGKNIMSDYNPLYAKITSLKEENGFIIIKMFLKIAFYDYVIDTRTEKVIRGHKHYRFKNMYRLEYIIGADNKEQKCPNCGAKIVNVTSGKCKYCGSVLVTKPKDYVLNKKNILK
ncbi:MAG: zinc-ribbon domain-containing transport protein [Bacilli bacterium]|nr:zinc-ribbon domain-containing transport protein [Bacilli bacterium]